MKMKIIFQLLLIFLSMEIFAQSEKSSPEFVLKTDLFAPMRGNSTVSLVLDYARSDSSKVFHSFGIEAVHSYLFTRSAKYPSRPTIKAAMPSGAIFYELNKKLFGDSPAFLGFQTLIGNYKYQYSRYACLESEEVPDARLCKCTNFVKNEFDYQNLKLSLAGNFGARGNFYGMFLGFTMRFGAYFIIPQEERFFLEDVINCSTIRALGEPSIVFSNQEQRELAHYTADFSGKTTVGVLAQVSLLVGFKF